MKLIKIDPQTRTLEAVECSGTLADFRQLIGCRLIDVCARQDTGDALTVDDEALYEEPQPAAFSFGDHDLIHGIAVLAGSDEEGETTAPVMTLEEASQRITWLGQIHTQPTFTLISW